MNTRLNIWRIGWYAGTLVALMLLGVAQANAEAVQVSPAFVDYEISPGDSLKYTMQVKNEGTEASKLGITIGDFYFDEQGNKVFVEGASLGDERFSMKNWISTDAEDIITLDPGQYQKINVSVDVPADAEPGGHYGVIYVTMLGNVAEGEEASGSSIGVQGRVAALVLIDVPGVVVKEGKVESFKAGVIEGASGGETFRVQESFETGPVAFEIAYHNLGTTHYFPEGNVSVEGGFSHEKWDLPVQPLSRDEKIRALPHSTRDFRVTLNQRKLFGNYTATLKMQDGNGVDLPPMTVSFWVMPVKTVVIWAIVIVLGLVLLTVLIKRYNKWVVSKSRA